MDDLIIHTHNTFCTSGGTIITLSGGGFIINKTEVAIGDSPCSITYMNTSNVFCLLQLSVI